MPEKGKTEDNDCFRMCLEALKTGKISANERRAFSMIYMNDALELAYRVLCEEKPKHSMYNISSAETINENSLPRRSEMRWGKVYRLLTAL